MRNRILIVEDSTTQALALQAVLEEHRFEVERADSAEQALECLAQRRYDLVLSDIVMPGMSGYELCGHIKRDETLGTMPVVLLTSLTDPLDIVRGLECGADNYVTKPYDSDYLAARIRNVMDRQRLRRTSKASLGVNVSFLGTTFTITSDKEQILDLFISSVEDVVRTNAALQESQRELAATQAQLEDYTRTLARQARVSEERYATLMLEANDAIMVLDRDGRILEANVRATELFGQPASRLRDQSIVGLADPGSAETLRSRFAALSGVPRVEAGEIEFVNAAGAHFHCDVSASLTTSGEDQLVFAILHDVTDLKRTTQRLRKSEALLMEAQRFAQLGSFERDLQTSTSQWTPETFRILGLDPTRVIPSPHTLIAQVHPEDRDRVAAVIRRICTDGTPVNSEFRIVRPDGVVRVLHTRAEAVREADGSPVLVRGTLQDVTDRKQLEEHLHQSQKIEAVGQLAGGVAHDFNNLLTVITSYCGIALSELEPDAPLREDLEEITAAAARAAALTRQLLAFSRRQVLQPQVVDVNALTQNLEKLLRRLIREDIHLDTAYDAGIGLVSADPGQLEQVLVNLVVNARDAMPNGGTLAVRTSQVDERGEPIHTGEHHEAQHGWVMIEVSDTGTGMSPEVQARMFEPFFTTKPVGQGTGLGLSTVYGIVRQSGGDIEVVSKEGQGTTFRVFIPCCEPVQPAPAPFRAALPRSSRGETILVVEDDAALRAVAARILRRTGYRVLEARTGKEALELCLDNGPVDLVLTDIVMPEMSGYALGQAIMGRHPATRMLYMSGYSRDVGLREGVVQNGSDYLEKPFSVETLAAKVREVLTRSA